MQKLCWFHFLQSCSFILPLSHMSSLSSCPPPHPGLEIRSLEQTFLAGFASVPILCCPPWRVCVCVCARMRKGFFNRRKLPPSPATMCRRRDWQSQSRVVCFPGESSISLFGRGVCVLSAGKGVGGEQSAIRHLELYEMKALFKEDCNHSTDSCDGELLLRFAGCCLGPNALCLHHMDLQTHASGGPAG